MKVFTVLALGLLGLIFVLLGIRASDEVETHINRKNVQPNLRDDVVKRSLKYECKCYCNRRQRIGRFFLRRPTGHCYCGDLQHYSRAWCKCYRAGNYYINYKDSCLCNCGYQCHVKYRCTCKKGQPWCSCGVDIAQFKKKIDAQKLLCSPPPGYHKPTPKPKQMKTVKGSVIKENKPYKGCDCNCSGSRYIRPRGERFGSFKKMNVGKCQCPNLIYRPVDWCICKGDFMTGRSRCHCKCNGEMCRTHFMCYCSAYSRRCRCVGIRRYYRKGPVMKTSDGLCEPSHRQTQGNAVANLGANHKGPCQCVCRGIRSQALVNNRHQQVTITTGHCQCDDFRRLNHANCHCTGHGIVFRDRCFCKCGETNCNHNYKCSCTESKCVCHALTKYDDRYRYYKESEREIFCGREETILSPPTIKPPPTTEPKLPCFCSCGGLSKFVKYGHYKRVKHINHGNCKCGNIALNSNSSCRCWGGAFTYRSNCKCSCNRKPVPTKVNCRCWGIGRHLCRCEKLKPKFKIIHIKKTTVQVKEGPLPDAIGANGPYLWKKKMAICKNFPVYACSLNLGTITYSRHCPGHIVHCSGHTLPIIANGKPAFYTFCDCGKGQGIPDYIKMAVQSSCNHGPNKKCPTGKYCRGGQLSVNYNNQQLALHYCVKPNKRFELLKVFGNHLDKLQHHEIFVKGKLSNHSKGSRVNVQKSQKVKPHGVKGRKKLNHP